MDQQGHVPLRVAVDLSPMQFERKNPTATIARIIADTEMDPHYLELELTEPRIMREAGYALEQLLALEALGIRLSIADVGTVHSSLTYLK